MENLRTWRRDILKNVPDKELPEGAQEHMAKMAAFCSKQGDGEFASRSRRVYDFLAENAGGELMLVLRRQK